MRTPSRRSPRTLAGLALAFAVAGGVVLTGCSSDGEKVTIATTTDPPPPATRARAACTEVLDQRSESVSRDAAAAATSLRDALDGQGEPPDQVLADVQDALGAERGQLADAQEALRAVELPEGDRADWSTVVDAAEPRLADLDATLAFLREPDWDRNPSTVGLGAPTPDRVALDGALERLDLLGSDCQWVYDYPGDPAAQEPFHRDGAAACSIAVERRRADDFDPASAPDEARREEWVATARDLGAVATGPLTDPAPWARIVAAARARATDPDEATPVDASLEALGLDRRPCAALFD